MSAPIDFASATPEEIYAAVAGMDPDGFAALMQGEHRAAVLSALVGHLSVLFRPDRAEGVDAVIHVKVWDRPGGGYDHLEVVIRDGVCTAGDAPAHEPRLTLKAGPGDLLGLVTGRAGPRRLALRGRLRVLGDLGLGMRLPQLFEFPSDR